MVAENCEVGAEKQAEGTSAVAVTGGEKALNLSTLTSMHRRVLYEEIARRVLERHSPERICFDLAISRNTLRAILKRQDFKHTFDIVYNRVYEPVDAALRDERMQVTDRLAVGSQRALTTLYELLDASKEDVKLKAATAVLDRAGYGPMTRKATVSLDTVKLDEESAAVLASVMQSAIKHGAVIDAVVEDIDASR